VHQRGLSGIETDLVGAVGLGEHFFGRQGEIAPGFQQAKSQVIGGAQVIEESMQE